MRTIKVLKKQIDDKPPTVFNVREFTKEINLGHLR